MSSPKDEDGNAEEIARLKGLVSRTNSELRESEARRHDLVKENDRLSSLLPIYAAGVPEGHDQFAMTATVSERDYIYNQKMIVVEGFLGGSFSGKDALKIGARESYLPEEVPNEHRRMLYKRLLFKAVRLGIETQLGEE